MRSAAALAPRYLEARAASVLFRVTGAYGAECNPSQASSWKVPGLAMAFSWVGLGSPYGRGPMHDDE
jgi:hypothetical protein